MKPTIPSVRERFLAYRDNGHAAWGSLHIVLDDGNIENRHVEWCLQHAVEYQDAEGEALARILLTMSKTQRHQMFRKL